MGETLKPCPFCGDNLNIKKHSAFHPPATLDKEWCWLSTAGEFGGCYELTEYYYAAWNQRHGHAALRTALENIVANAVIQPDASMAGTTDCYAVPLDDIEAARRALEES